MQDEEKQFIEYIHNNSLVENLLNIRQSIDELWSDGIKIIQNYTDHGLKHSQRIIKHITNLLKIGNQEVGQFLNIDELYILVACAYLHDIGMQCDIARFPEVKKIASEFGAQFSEEFNARDSSIYTIEEQNDIRKNHQFITAAWLDCIYRNENIGLDDRSKLKQSIKAISQEYIGAIVDICRYHSKLNISEFLADDKVVGSLDRYKEQFLAALVRFGDELDIDRKRVSIETVINFKLDPQNALYWWIHNNTEIKYNQNIISIIIKLQEEDFNKFGEFIYKTFIKIFSEKNQKIIEVLRNNHINIAIDASSNVKIDRYINRLPNEIVNYLAILRSESVSGSARTTAIKTNTSANSVAEFPMPIKSIYFGDVDATYECEDDQALFKRNYYDVGGIVSDLLKRNSKFFVMGKKGSGKTAIGKYIDLIGDNKWDTQYIDCSKLDYRYLSKIRDTSADEYEQYSRPWEWVILSYLLYKLIKDEEQNTNYTEQLVNQIFNTGIDLSILINDKSIWQSKEIYIDGELKKINALQAIRVYKNYIEKCKWNDKKYVFVFDGLDEKIKNSREYTDAIAGLFWTVIRLNNEFVTKNIPVKVIVLLRHDVFELVTGPNISKIKNGRTIDISWVNDSEDKLTYPLYSLLSHRINNSLLDNGYESVNNPLKLILPDTVNSQNTWSWLLDYTTYKPRDVIKYLLCCQELCNDENRITESICWNALIGYSSYLVDEFKDELYGFINDAMIKEIFEILLPNLSEHIKNREKFTFNEWIKAVNETKKCYGYGIVNALTLLYKVGIIGKYDARGFADWSYRTKKSKEFKLNPASDQFQIHRGLWKYLHIW